MRKLYNEFFYIPKHGKIREKVMLARVAAIIAIMIMCLAAMSITAYAYFSYNVTSGSNVIKAANFDAQITVVDENNQPVNPSSTNGKKTAFTFASTGTYTVNLEKGNSTADTGFCIVYVGNDKYHTQQIGVDINENNSERKLVTFALVVNEPNTVVTIESHWGTSSYYDFCSDEKNDFYIISSDPPKVIEIGVPVNGANESDEEKETASDETTATEATPTEVVYTVQSGDTLSKIVAEYSTTVERIVAYNQLTDKNNIQVGQQLKIPPTDWVIPADTTEQTTATPETTAPTTETTQPADTTAPETTGTSEPTDTTEPSTSTTEPTTTQSTETSATETTGTDSTEQTQPVTETSETTGAPTTEASED